jgi:hypothetical protein
MEQQVTNSLLARFAYVASHSSHQWLPVEINPVFNADALPTTDPNFGKRMYAKVGCTSCYTQPITEFNLGGNGAYNSLQVSAEQRVRYGLTLLANYTWSKALDNLPYNAAATSIGAGNSYVYPIYEPNFRRLDHGPSDFDHRNVISVSYVYVIPSVKESPGVVRFLVNGWQTSGLFQFRSGDPLTISSNSNNASGSGQNRDRAVLVGNPYGGNACGSTTPCKSYLNPASFQNNAPATYGNIRKGSLVGPRYTDWDVSLSRNFNFTERLYLQFRAEYFNVLNHTNFGDPATTNSGSIGRITGTTPQNGASPNDPRIGQLSLKLIF